MRTSDLEDVNDRIYELFRVAGFARIRVVGEEQAAVIVAGRDWARMWYGEAWGRLVAPGEDIEAGKRELTAAVRAPRQQGEWHRPSQTSVEEA